MCCLFMIIESVSALAEYVYQCQILMYEEKEGLFFEKVREKTKQLEVMETSKINKTTTKMFEQT